MPKQRSNQRGLSGLSKAEQTSAHSQPLLITTDTLVKEMQPVPALLPGKSHGRRRLVATVPGVGRVRPHQATRPPPPLDTCAETRRAFGFYRLCEAFL